MFWYIPNQIDDPETILTSMEKHLEDGNIILAGELRQELLRDYRDVPGIVKRVKDIYDRHSRKGITP